MEVVVGLVGGGLSIVLLQATSIDGEGVTGGPGTGASY